MTELEQKIQKYGIIPVVVLNKVQDAIPLGKALLAGGLPVAEVTFRTSAAEDSIKILCKEYPDLLIGAGTVLTIEQVNRAVNAGAEFIVTPGFNSKVVQYCIKEKIPVIPGCSTPSDIEKALELGIHTVKFFPAEQAGGLPMIRSLSGPYTDVYYVPTGGINMGNIKDYLKNEKILACGGTWMVKNDLIQSERFDQIQALTKEAVDAVKDVRGE